jgi:hypothetical protein
MRYLFLIGFTILAFAGLGQNDSIRVIEPDRETSFENFELLAIAIIGLLLLIGLRFWFRRTRKH